MATLSAPALGLRPTSDINLDELDELARLAAREEAADRALMLRDLRLARSVHTFYGPAAPRPPAGLAEAAFQRFGERTRVG